MSVPTKRGRGRPGTFILPPPGRWGRAVARVLAPATAMLLLPSGAAPQQSIEVLGQSVELPAATGPIRVEQRVECSCRSRWLRPLLLGQAALHGADAHSTRRVIRAGGAEANPLMRWATLSDRRAYGVKAAVMTGNWWLTERLSCPASCRGRLDDGGHEQLPDPGGCAQLPDREHVARGSVSGLCARHVADKCRREERWGEFRKQWCRNAAMATA